MITYKNSFNEIVSKWENTIHPDNPNFMQKVFWTMYEKEDGRITVCYKIDFNGKSKFIYNLTKEEILKKYF